jgi:dTDP-glucose 4,6-dehydratase
MPQTGVLVTGGAGFVGSHLCKELLDRGYQVTCYDSLDPTLMNPRTLEFLGLSNRSAFQRVEGNVLDFSAVARAVKGHDAVIHAAAIASVDRSIKSPRDAVETSVMGTLNVLEAAREVGVNRVHYVSTDEVYGQSAGGLFHEHSPSVPRNPYAAGKAGGEAIVHAWGATFGLNTTITNSCNTYGPFQALDKLIPRLTARAALGMTLPVYGDGLHVREWLHITDHVAAIVLVLENGQPGESYCVGSGERVMNLEVTQRILDCAGPTGSRIEHIEDRRGHDRRYAVDASKIRALGWKPQCSFDYELEKTANWYFEYRAWWEHFADLNSV